MYGLDASYVVDVGDILHDLGSSIAVKDELSLDDIHYNEILFVFDGPAHFDALITNTGAGLVLSGEVSASIRTDCSRCLESFVFRLDADIEGFFTTQDKAAELPEDQEWEPVHNDAVDILPSVISAITIELPIAPVHDPQCRGICPECGCDLNASTCSCESPDQSPSPFEGLRSLFKDSN